MTGDVFTYTASGSIADYNEDKVKLVEEVLDYYEASVDFSEYDADGDGVIDCRCDHQSEHSGAAADNRVYVLWPGGHPHHQSGLPDGRPGRGAVPICPYQLADWIGE